MDMKPELLNGGELMFWLVAWNMFILPFSWE